MVATLDDVVGSLDVLHADLLNVVSLLTEGNGIIAGFPTLITNAFAASLFTAYIAILINGIPVPDGMVAFLEQYLGFPMPTTIFPQVAITQSVKGRL